MPAVVNWTPSQIQYDSDYGLFKLFLSINCSIRCINELFFMLIGFCLFVFVFVVTAVSIVCIALVDLDPNSKMSPTFAYPHVKVIFAFNVTYV